MWKQRIIATATLASAAFSVAFPFTSQTTDRVASAPLPVRSPAPATRVLPLGAGDADFGDAPDGIPGCEGSTSCDDVTGYPTLFGTANAAPGRTAPYHTGDDVAVDYWLGDSPSQELDAFQPCCDWLSALGGGPDADLDDAPLILCLDAACGSGVVVMPIAGVMTAVGCFGPMPPFPTTGFWIYEVGMGASAPAAEDRFINIAVDVNLNGVFGDLAVEWVDQDTPFPYVPDGVAVMGSGLFPVLVVFACGAPAGWCIGPFWTRFHAGPESMLAAFPGGTWEGSGAPGGYTRGETEDWVVACDPQTGGGSCPGAGDCNGNGRPDLVDVLMGTSQDNDGNRIPDECGGNVVFENEPNGTKAEAASCTLIDGDSLQGFTNGNSTTPGNTSTATADIYLVQTAPLPAGIYQHRLVLQGASGLTGSIRGLLVSAGPPPVITTTDVSVQTSSPTTDPPSFNQWYGFGCEESIYYRVVGTASTGSYTATLETTRVQAQPIPHTFAAGPITITTVGQGGGDTEIHVYDADLRPISGYKNDDASTTVTQSILTRSYSPGLYHVAVSRFNTCDDELTGADDAFQAGNVLDFPRALLSSGTAGGSALNLSFRVQDGVHDVAVQEFLPSQGSAYEVAWFRLYVGGAGGGGPVQSFCSPGFSSVSPCPCSNPPSGPNRGCNNSNSTGGAALTWTGTTVPDTLVLTSSGELNTALSIFLQGDNSISSGTVFGDGIRCTGGVLKRLYVENAAGGTVSAPGPGDPSITARSAALGDPIAPGSVRWYQVYYRDPSAIFCPPNTWNVSNGVEAHW